MKKPAKKKDVMPDPGPPVELPNPMGEEKYGARPSTVTVCAFCKHEYIRPCTAEQKDICPNYIHLQQERKKK